jgi:hypothetical protein
MVCDLPEFHLLYFEQTGFEVGRPETLRFTKPAGQHFSSLKLTVFVTGVEKFPGGLKITKLLLVRAPAMERSIFRSGGCKRPPAGSGEIQTRWGDNQKKRLAPRKQGGPCAQADAGVFSNF